MMGCLEVFDSVKATISPDFVDSIPPDIEKMKFVEEVAIKVGLEVVLDFENIIFVGSFKSISEGRKCFLNYMDRWYELKETLRCVDKELDESSCTASKLENEYSVLSVEESLETKDITESELYMDDANAIYEQDTSMNNEHLQLTQLNISFRDTFDEHQALDTSQSNLLDNTLLDQIVTV